MKQNANKLTPFLNHPHHPGSLPPTYPTSNMIVNKIANTPLSTPL